MRPTLATDLIIEHHDGQKEGIVLIERKHPPYGIALPGGLAEYGLTLEENARKEGQEETGLEVEIGNPGRPWVRSRPGRDPRCHMVSALYWGRGSGTLRAGDDAAGAGIYTPAEVAGMLGQGRFAFDHEEMLVEWMRWRGYL